MDSPRTRMYTHPFFEATPPGAAPGPPVKNRGPCSPLPGVQKPGYLRPQIGVFSFLDLIFTYQKKKSPELEDGHRQKMSPKFGDLFSDKVFLGCTCADVPISTFRPPMKHSWKALEFL